jgi:hypothetical protein
MDAGAGPWPVATTGTAEDGDSEARMMKARSNPSFARRTRM